MHCDETSILRQSLSLKNSVIVLILNYNSWEATISYISQLRKQEEISLCCLVVDNCSPDGSYEKLKDFYKRSEDVLVIITDKNGGYSYGNNFGLKFLEELGLKNNFVIISNNDITLDNSYLIYELIENYKKCKDVAFVSPVMHIHNTETKKSAWILPSVMVETLVLLPFIRNKIYKSIYYSFSRNDILNHKVDCLPGSFFMGRLHTFKEIGYFDERIFLYGEERIIGKKVKIAGKFNYLVRSLKYNHLKSETEIFSLKKITDMFKGKEIYYRHYDNIPRLHIILLKIVHFSYLISLSIRQRMRRKCKYL